MEENESLSTVVDCVEPTKGFTMEQTCSAVSMTTGKFEDSPAVYGNITSHKIFNFARVNIHYIKF